MGKGHATATTETYPPQLRFFLREHDNQQVSNRGTFPIWKRLLHHSLGDGAHVLLGSFVGSDLQDHLPHLVNFFTGSFLNVGLRCFCVFLQKGNRFLRS